MKKFRATIITLCLLAAGSAVLLWQSSAPDNPESGGRRGASAPVAAKTEEVSGGGSGGAEDGPAEAPVSLAILTEGAEETADVSKSDAALTLKLAEKLGSLTKEERRAVFAAVTRQLNLLTAEELKARTSGDPEKRRAMLLIPALTGLLQRSDPLTVLAWTADPGNSPLWKRKLGRMAA